MSAQQSKRKVGGVSAQVQVVGDAVTTGRRKVGGVSARMSGHQTREAAGIGPNAGPTSPIHGDFVYNGGAVITCPLIYASFWGNRWLADAAHLTAAARLTQFLTDLVASKYMNVLAQYGVGSGVGSGLFIQASFIQNVPLNLTDNNIHTILQTAINNGVIPEPPQNNRTHVQIIYLDETIAVNDPNLGIVMCEPSGDNAFGYHFDFTTAAGNEFYYAVIPALTDACLTNSCGGGGCSLHLSQTQEQRRTQVTSHEFAEMVTDPKFKKGWWGPSSDENGDICNGEADSITVGPNTWDVQRQYSKFDDINTNGATFCITEAPNPIPKLSPGPSGLSAAMASARRMGNYQSFLPLATSHFDLKTNKFSLDESEVQRYVTRLFAPLRHENVFADLPAILRSVADTLEKNK